MPAYRINGKNVLFIHVPKTGGTTLAAFLAAYSSTSLHNRGVKLLKPIEGGALTRSLPLQHFHGRLLESMFAADFFDYSFMVVRDPLERMKSEYRHSGILGRIDARLPFGPWLSLTLGLSSLAPNIRNNHYRPQADFHCFNANVFRFEEGLQSIAARVATRLGVTTPTAVPHERRTDEAEIEVSRASLARIRRFYAADYETFGY
jgi:hypothetical protein